MSQRARTTTTGDGFVTWGTLNRVLELALNPIEETLDEVRADVKLLLADRSERKGAADERSRWLDSRRFTLGLIVTLVVGLVGAVATILWLTS